MGGGRFLRNTFFYFYFWGAQGHDILTRCGNDDDTAGFPKLTPKNLKHIHLELGDDYKSRLISFLVFSPSDEFWILAGSAHQGCDACCNEICT